MPAFNARRCLSRRTGRRGNPSEMWFVMREEHAEARAMLPEILPWYLIQGIALVQLYTMRSPVRPTIRPPVSVLAMWSISSRCSSSVRKSSWVMR